MIQNKNELVTGNSSGSNRDWKDEMIPLVKCSQDQWTSFGISDM